MLREQEKELRETEEKRTRLVKEVWTGSHDIYSQACPAALETGSYVLIFVLSRVCEENDVEIQWLQSKKKFSYDIKFRTFSKVRNVRKCHDFQSTLL